jgi:hypothetical protein
LAYARVSYTGNGSTKIFTVPFPYISNAHIEVRVGGVLKTVTTDYTWLTTSTIQFVTAPTTGTVIYLLRNTPKQERLVNFQDAAVLREADLDLSADQAFYIVQEAMDAANNTQAIETFIGGVDYTAGVSNSLTLGAGDIEMSNITVLFDAAAQQQTEYTVVAGVITFDSVIPTGVLQIQVSYATPLTSGMIDGSVTTSVIADLSVTQAKLAQAVYSDLTAVTPVVGDYVPISDVSDSGNKKKTLISSILSLIASATTSVLGLVQLATGAEALGGADTAKAVTSAGLASVKLNAANGYHKYPGGRIEQWGAVATGGGGSVVVTFPVAFPATLYNITLSVNAAVSVVVTFQSHSITGFTANTWNPATGAALAGVSFHWRATGI